MKSDDKTFLRITNKELYKEMKDGFKELHIKIDELSSLNQMNCQQIMKRQDVTNGKVKLQFWLASTALMLVVILIGLFVEHVGK